MTRARRIAELGELLLPSEAEEPILARSVRGALLEWLTEIWAEEELLAVGLSARRRALFAGLPGTGKTTLAHHLAARLGLPMAVVRPDDIHGRYVGAGTAQIKAIFDAAQAHEEPIVLFFDEFETAAQKRMHSGVNEAVEHDHNAMVNTLLARIEAYGSFIIAATNRADAIDPAIWRRFDIHITLETPGQVGRQRILARYFAPFGLPKHALEALATLLDDQFEILGFRFGINFIIDLIPVAGDVITTIIALYVFFAALRYKVSVWTVARMIFNIAVYFIVGLIPYLGDIFGAWWKPNKRNVNLVRRSIAKTS